MFHSVQDDAARAAAAERYRTPDVLDDAVLADAARLAASIAGTAMAAVMLLGEEHLWVVAAVGIGVTRINRAESFCERTVMLGERVVVEDMLDDPAFARSPYVVSGPKIRYYAGLPMASRDGHVIGTLCIADRQPRRPVTEEQFRHLALLLEITIDRLEQRRTAAERAAALAAAHALSQTLGSEAASLACEAERLHHAARTHEMATDAAMQGVRQIVLLDREIHDSITGRPRGGAIASPDPLPDALASQLTLHNTISMATEEDIDALVGSAAALRHRSGNLQGQGQRLVDLSFMLDDIVAAEPGEPAR